MKTEPVLDYGKGEGRHALRLTAALQDVLERTGAAGDGVVDEGKPLTLGLIVEVTGERAFGVLMAFLCLPFLTPIPLPGLSIVFGVALLMLGVQVAVRKDRPWLPARMMAVRLPPKFGPRLIRAVAKLFRPLEKVIRPRLLVMQQPWAMVLVGAALCVDGFLLSLPLPPVIPLSNALPAWMALIKILGITEEDGVALIVGVVLTTALAVAGGVLLGMGWEKVTHLW